ncbi:hypothetical protein [Chromatium okenii]|uniref:hypothetical protein n=1 Tax=Chromatium okenii TaxID=61644 RepID=UPI0026F1EF4D|nr:hypothetical protein [Chromatium okenii]MBV5310821.1 hypothetical protein [Chromatium okenii]
MSISTSQMIRFSPDPPQAGSSEVVTRFTMSFTTELKGVYRTSYLTESGLKARLTIPFKIPGEDDDDGDLGDACKRAHLMGINPYGHAPLVVDEAGYWGSTCGYSNPNVDDFVVYFDDSSCCELHIDLPCNNLAKYFSWPSAVVFVDPEKLDPDADPIEFELIGEVSGGTEDDPFDLDTLSEKDIGNYYTIVTEGWFSCDAVTNPFSAQANKIIVWLAHERAVVADLGATGETNVELKLDSFEDVKVAMQLVLVREPDPFISPIARETVMEEKIIDLSASGMSSVTASSSAIVLTSSAVAAAVEDHPGEYDIYWRIYKYSGDMIYSATCNGTHLPETITDSRTAGSALFSILMTSEIYVAHALVTQKPYPFFIGGAPYFNINTNGDARNVNINDRAIHIGSINGYWTASDGTIVSWSGSAIIMGARRVLGAPTTVCCACIVKIGGVEYMQVLAVSGGRVEIYSHALIAGKEWEELGSVALPKKTVGDSNYTPKPAYWSFSKSGTKCMSFYLGKVCVVWEASVDDGGNISAFTEVKTHEFATDLMVSANTKQDQDEGGIVTSSSDIQFESIAMICAFYKDDTAVVRTAKIKYSAQSSSWQDNNDPLAPNTVTLAKSITLSVCDNGSEITTKDVITQSHFYGYEVAGEVETVVGESLLKKCIACSCLRDDALFVITGSEIKSVWSFNEEDGMQEIIGYVDGAEKGRDTGIYDYSRKLSFPGCNSLPATAGYYNKLYNTDDLLFDFSSEVANIYIPGNGITSMVYSDDAENKDLLSIAKGYSDYFRFGDLLQIPTAVAQNTRFIAASAKPVLGLDIHRASVGGTVLSGITSFSNFQVTSPRACVFKPDPDLPPKAD